MQTNQSNIIFFSNDYESIQQKLFHMKELKQQLKALEAEFDMYKLQVIKDYFDDEEEFLTPKGLILATYQGIKTDRFDESRFKKENPIIHESYIKQSISFRFTLK